VPVGAAWAVTWLNSYSVTQPFAHPAIPAGPAAEPPASPAAAQVFDSNQAVRFTLLPADTTVSLAAAISSANDKWVRSMSAEQKLFGGPVSVTGTVQETQTGAFNKSLKAGWKQTW
jgi:hypothetical protein